MRPFILALACMGTITVLLTGTLRGGHSTLGCSECHVPHNPGNGAANGRTLAVPLWNSRSVEDLPTFTIYTSPTFDALGTDIGQPDGASKLCLGCHDDSRTMTGVGTPRPGIGALGGSHPISFTYDSGLASRAMSNGLKDPSSSSGLGGTITHDLLDDSRKMQCTSCHDPHSTTTNQYLLRYPYDPESRGTRILCRVCHNR